MAKTKTITIDVVKNLQAGSIQWDSKVVGFGVRRQRSEARTYLIKTSIDRRQRWLVIGRHGAPWTPETARREARRLMGLLASGDDLATLRDEGKAALTISELCDQYMENAAANKVLTKIGNPKKASTLATDRGRIERHIKPLLGSKRARDLTQQDVRGFLKDIAVGKTAVDVKTIRHGRAIVSGGRGAATRTVGLLGGIMSYAVEQNMRTDNPVRGISRYPDRKEERFLSPEEIGRLGDALTAAERDGVNIVALAAIKLLLLTGCRKLEILTLQWNAVDFANSFLRLADSKTGKKDVPLGLPAIELLESLPRLEGNLYVIPGTKPGGHFVGLPKIWNRLRNQAELDWATLHILRHSFASMGASAGLGLPIIGRILGHRDASTTQRYAKVSADPAKAAVDWISGAIAAALERKSANNLESVR